MTSQEVIKAPMDGRANRKAGTVSLFPLFGFAGEESKLSLLFDSAGVEITSEHPHKV